LKKRLNKRSNGVFKLMSRLLFLYYLHRNKNVPLIALVDLKSKR